MKLFKLFNTDPTPVTLKRGYRHGVGALGAFGAVALLSTYPQTLSGSNFARKEKVKDTASESFLSPKNK